MERRADTDWRDNKSVTERNCYMFDNEISTDVCFEIPQDNDELPALVRAHEYVLLSSSPIFEAMLTGGMVEGRADRGNIEIVDIDVSTFRRMLRYIYCDKTDISAETALPLLYAAKKYLLTRLVKKCVEVLGNELSVKNVCISLQNSISLDEQDLKSKCLEFVSRNTREVLKTEEFLEISSSALEAIVGLDCVAGTSERKLYAYCVKWAKHQLSKAGNESPTNTHIRNTLGKVLYLIRFPTMIPKDFAELMAESDVLTPDEKNDIYAFLNIEKRLESLAFPTSKRQVESRKRKVEIQKLDRLVVNNSGSYSWLAGQYQTETIWCQSRFQLCLSGVGLYGGKSGLSTHHVTLQISTAGDILSTTVRQMLSDGSSTPVQIKLDKPVLMQPGMWYAIAATMKGPPTWCGRTSRVNHMKLDAGYIYFHDLNARQIPQLFYYVA